MRYFVSFQMGYPNEFPTISNTEIEGDPIRNLDDIREIEENLAKDMMRVIHLPGGEKTEAIPNIKILHFQPF